MHNRDSTASGATNTGSGTIQDIHIGHWKDRTGAMGRRDVQRGRKSLKTAFVSSYRISNLPQPRIYFRRGRGGRATGSWRTGNWRAFRAYIIRRGYNDRRRSACSRIRVRNVADRRDLHTDTTRSVEFGKIKRLGGRLRESRDRVKDQRDSPVFIQVGFAFPQRIRSGEGNVCPQLRNFVRHIRSIRLQCR